MSGDESSMKNIGNRLWAIVILFMVMNMGVLGYVTLFRDEPIGGADVEALSVELDNLRYQMSAAQLEIDSLRDEIRISREANYTDTLILTQLYNRTRRGVVLITVITAEGGGAGSGFVYDMEGRIVTNNHVVEGAVDDARAKVEVTFLDGTIAEAEIVGTDPYSDMAVIKVDVPDEILFPVNITASTDLLVGEMVVAIGNPFGLANTMTMGIVSAVGRQMEAPGNYVVVDVIQTDAAINPGNSGGPLLNLRGQVIGMNTAIISSTREFSGIGFAVPSDTVLREIDALIKTGRYRHPWIGIEGRNISPDIAEAMGLDRDTKGTLVSAISEDGPASLAGLQGSTETVTIDGFPLGIGGDVIIGVDDRITNTFYDLIFYVSRSKQPGDTITLNIIRTGEDGEKEIMDVDLILGVRPPPS